MAVIATPLLLLVFGIIEFGRALWLANALNYSVEEAARCAAVNTAICGTSSAVKSFAAGSSGAGFTNATFTLATAACGQLVTATYPMQLDILLGTYSITLSATACFPT